MRTTIDLPEELHAYASRLARARRTTLSKVFVELAQAGVTANEPSGSDRLIEDARTGRVLLRFTHPITEEDVHSLDDEA